jgi:hypothetical protein
VVTATFEFTRALLAVIARLAKPLAQVNQCARLADSAFRLLFVCKGLQMICESETKVFGLRD